ncbi:RecBCD enzyme subunit RecD [Gammaproteobacteria bacterium]
MSNEELIILINVWMARGWLRELDQAFLSFLWKLDPSADSFFLLAAALVSHQLGRGHVCLDLKATLEAPDEILSLPPEGENSGPFMSGAWPTSSGSPEFPSSVVVLPSNVLARITLSNWQCSIRKSSLVAGGSGSTPLVLVDNRLYLRRYWEYEQRVATAIHDRLARIVSVPEDLRVRLERLFPERVLGGPDWQKIACALAARGSFSVITGGPGTGKTTTVVRLLALLQGTARQPEGKLRIRLAAPTGKAAARLTESISKALDKIPEAMREAIPTEASTLHRLLGSRPGSRHFRHNADNPLHADLVVIDESSMIDLEIMAALFSALRPETCLILLGDKDQLASVEAGSVLGDLCQNAEQNGYLSDTVNWISATIGEDVSTWHGNGGKLAQQLIMLRVSHRFTAHSGIGKLAVAVNSGQTHVVRTLWDHIPPYTDITRILLRDESDGNLEKLVVDGTIEKPSISPLVAEKGEAAPITTGGYRHYLELLQRRRPPLRATFDDYEQWAKSILDAFDQFQLLCALRRGPWGVEGLNQRIAEALYQTKLIDQLHGWYEGRPILVTRNDYSLGLMNGDIGIALRFPERIDTDNVLRASGDIAPTRLRVVFRLPDGGIKQVLPSRLTNIETVYAMTVHKSQGSEFDHVALVLPDKNNPVLTRELIYTGITRARHRFTMLLSDTTVLEQSVTRRVRRFGGLAQLLP